MTSKLGLPFTLLSDPGGKGAIKPWGLWDPEEGGRSHTAVLVMAPEGREFYRHRGLAYVDRADEDEVIAAVRALGLALRHPGDRVHAHAAAEPGPRTFPHESLTFYMRGVRGSSQALCRGQAQLRAASW